MSFRIRDQERDTDSPREAGEIDTRAPFQSVKAAVSLFGEVAVSKEKRSIKRRSSENVLEKETQLLLAQRELNKIKKQLESAENTKSKALSELDKANVTLQELTKKLNSVRESKQSAIEAAEAVKNQAKELEQALSQKAIGYEAWKQELEHARKEYTTTVKELDASKQELNKIRQDFDTALEAKLAAFQTAGEAQRSAKLNTEKLHELKNQVATMKEQIEHLKLASSQAQEDQAKAMEEREARLSFYENAKEEAQNKLIALKNEYEPELTQSLEAKLAETSEEIQVLQKQIQEAHASEMDSVRLITLEIKEATKTLQEVAEEETSLRDLVDSLRKELEQVKKEQEELKEKEKAAEALAVDLTDQLQSKPEETMDKESDNIDEIELKIKHLSFETETARREEEEMRSKTQELKQEAEKSKAVAEELEKKLELYLKQAEEAKAAEQRAIEEMKMMSDSDNTQDTVSVADSNGKIVLTVDEFAALSGKIKESEDLIDRTETAVMAQVEAINSRKNEVDRKVEANLKAIEEIKAATDMALRNAEMADSAKVAVEGELKKWRQEEQNLDYSDNSSRPISLRI
ncbi:WEB family protein At1g12150-like [Glycine soja]|uniref:WEB family protein n=1 Tax=Glycine soja TaxID=3848 RepID=A0A445GSB0_GLYSO|nr:WEB family protein At1g12150-like [Glycine soja]KHN14417.1 WEB family protein [Glycine soja]RZB64217.1 WEB family protein [Glycine soja]